MGLLNSTFVEGDSLPGSAKGWALVSRCQAERWAAFGDAPATAYDDFERWSVRELALGPGQLAIGFFSPGGLGREGFDRGWANDLYQTQLSLALSTEALFAGLPMEAFDWAFLFSAWASVQTVGAVFAGGSQGAEWFDSGWSNNGFRTTWTFVPSASATFSGTPVETFQGAWPHTVTL